MDLEFASGCDLCDRQARSDIPLLSYALLLKLLLCVALILLIWNYPVISGSLVTALR